MPAISTATALAITGIAAAGVGTAVTAVGQIKAGNAAERAGEYNAQTAELNATHAAEDAKIREDQQRYKDRQVMGHARALVGSSGVEFSGSPLAVLAENARQSEMDALLVRRGGALEAQAYQREAQSSRMQGKAAKTASRYGAAGTLLTGGYNIAKDIYTFRNLRRPSGAKINV